MTSSGYANFHNSNLLQRSAGLNRDPFPGFSRSWGFLRAEAADPSPVHADPRDGFPPEGSGQDSEDDGGVGGRG